MVLYAVKTTILTPTFKLASSFMRPWSRSSPPSVDLVRTNRPENFDLDCLSPGESGYDQSNSAISHITHHSDLYTVLGVSRSANQDELRRAYMSMCRRCHPECVLLQPFRNWRDSRFPTFMQQIPERTHGDGRVSKTFLCILYSLRS